MKAFISTVLVTHALRTSAFTALFLGLVATAPAYGQDFERERLDRLNSENHASVPTPSTQSERDPLAAGTELLLDGGFENGYYGGIQKFGTSGVTGPWTWFNNPAAPDPTWSNYADDVAHTGSFFAYFNPFGESYSALYQTVSIPSGVTATFSFWLKIFNSSPTHSVAYDTIIVSITDSTGRTELSRLTTYSNLNANAAYVKHTFDVSAFAGRIVMIAFNVHEGLNSSTRFELDDVSILASSASAGTCTEDTLTMCLVNGRYKVTSRWLNQYAGAGGWPETLFKAKLTDVTGAFWITDANTYEYLIRIQTGTNNGRAWISIPTFTDVEFWVAVTDTVNGQYKEYHSAPGNKTLIYDPFFFVYP